MPVGSILDFLEALIYVPSSEELHGEVRKLAPLSPFADSMEDLAWHRGAGAHGLKAGHAGPEK